MTALTAIPGPPVDADALGETHRRSASSRPALVRPASGITTRSTPQVLAVLLVVASTFAPTSAVAEPAPLHGDELVGSPTVTDYDTVLDDAVEAFDKQDYARARVLFERALALRPNARVLRGLGIAALHLKRFTSARRELHASLSDTRQPLTAAQREGVEELLSWMESHLGTVHLQLRPTYARLTVGEEQIVATELVLEPGVHSLRVSSDGFEPQEHSITIEAGKEQTLAIALEPHAVEPRISTRTTAATPHPPAPAAALPRSAATPARDHDSSSVFESWWFWTAVGVAVAGGVATTVILTSKQSEPSYQKGGFGGVMEVLRWTP